MRRPKGRAAAILFALCAMGLAGAGSVSSLAATSALTTTSPYAFTPGLPWADTSGNLIQGHNGSILKLSGSSLYYWVGQNLASNGPRQDAACYQSTDLVHWAPVAGFTLSVAKNPSLSLPTGESAPSFWLLGATKLIEASSTNFVIWASMKIHRTDGTNTSGYVDVATSSTPCGQYTWQNATPWQPQADGYSHPVGDIGLFNDTTTGTAYLLSSDAGFNTCIWNKPGTKNCVEAEHPPADPSKLVLVQPITECKQGDSDLCVFEPGIRIFQLQAGDTQILGSDFDIHQPDGQPLEAPAMFWNDSKQLYYVLMSETTNWKPNDNWYSSSSSITTGWSALQKIYVPLRSTAGPTCDTQTMWVQPVTGTDPTAPNTTYIYLGDRWDSSHITDAAGDSLGDSSYFWLPLSFTNGGVAGNSPTVPTLDCAIHNWSLSLATGNWVNLGPNFTDAMFTLTTSNGSGQVIAAGSGAAASLAQRDSDPQQQWQIIEETYTPDPDPSFNPPKPTTDFRPRYEILNVASGTSRKVLQDDGSGTLDQGTAGAAPPASLTCAARPADPEVSTEHSNLPPYQEWQFVSVNNGPGLMLKNICTGNVAQVSAAGTLTIGQAAGTPSQQWLLTEVPSFWAYTSAGNVYNQDGAPWFGSKANAGVTDVVGLAPTPDGEGYWLVGSKGEVWDFGDAALVTTVITTSCATGKIAGVASAGSAGGFYAFDACGNVYAEAGATPHGSATPARADIAGLASTPDGKGYWIVESDGTVWTFGDAANFPPVQTITTSCPGGIDGAATDPAGGFYAFTDCGNVYNEAGASWFKSLANSVTDVEGFAATADGNGYWLIRVDSQGNGTLTAFGDATSDTSTLSGFLGAAGNPNV